MPTNDDTNNRGIRQYSSDDFRYYLAPLRGFDGLQVPVIRLPDDSVWFPIAAICEDVLHVTTARQVQKLRSSGSTARLVEEFKVKTAQGMRRALFLHFDGIGHWLQIINPNKLPEGNPLRETLPRFQAAALAAVNAVLHGLLPVLTAEEAGPQSQALTLAGVQAYAEFLETKVVNLEQLLPRRPYVNEADEEGIINVPFTCRHGESYIVRLRQSPWQAPEVVEIVREGGEE